MPLKIMSTLYLHVLFSPPLWFNLKSKTNIANWMFLEGNLILPNINYKTLPFIITNQYFNYCWSLIIYF